MMSLFTNSAVHRLRDSSDLDIISTIIKSQPSKIVVVVSAL